MRIYAHAKVNLGLQVRAPDRSGLHPIRSLVQSIGWFDTVDVDLSDDDAFAFHGPDDIPDDETNLAWRAVEAVRRAANTRRPIALRLAKEVPHAAGLGGGSADAAAALVGTARLLRQAEPKEEAVALGADVSFCMVGGLAWMEGYGEVVTSMQPGDDYYLGVVVPPIELPTPEVYRRWDRLGGPQGPAIGGRDLPGSLREHGPLRNDLTPAAVALCPELGDWISDLSSLWGQPVAMTGSGSGLFGFFSTADEAVEAVAVVRGARGVHGGAPSPVGVRFATAESSEDA